MFVLVRVLDRGHRLLDGFFRRLFSFALLEKLQNLTAQLKIVRKDFFDRFHPADFLKPLFLVERFPSAIQGFLFADCVGRGAPQLMETLPFHV